MAGNGGGRSVDALVDDLFAEDTDVPAVHPPPVQHTIPMARNIPTTAPNMVHNIPGVPKHMTAVPHGTTGLSSLSAGYPQHGRPPTVVATLPPKGPMTAPQTASSIPKYPPQQQHGAPAQGIILPASVPSTGFAGTQPKMVVTGAPGAGLASISTATATRPGMVNSPVLAGATTISGGNSGPPSAARPQPVSSASATAAMSRPAPSTTTSAGPAAKKQATGEGGQTRARNADGSAVSVKNEDDDEDDLITKEVEYVAPEPIRHGVNTMNEEQNRRERAKDDSRRVANVTVIRAKIDEICAKEKLGVGAKVADALALGLQRRLEDVMKGLVTLSKRRLDTDADSSDYVVRSSNVRLFFKEQEQKKTEAREKRIAEREAAVAGTSVMDPSAQRRQEEETAATVLDMAAPRRITTLSLASTLAPAANSTTGPLSSATAGSNTTTYSSGAASSIKERQRRVTLHDAVHFLTSDPHSRHSRLTLSTLAGLKVPEPSSITQAQYASTSISAPTPSSGAQTRSMAANVVSHPPGGATVSTNMPPARTTPPQSQQVQSHIPVNTAPRPITAQNVGPHSSSATAAMTSAGVPNNGGLAGFTTASHPGQIQPGTYQVRPQQGQIVSSVKPMSTTALPSAAPVANRPSAAPVPSAKPAVSTRSSAKR